MGRWCPGMGNQESSQGGLEQEAGRRGAASRSQGLMRVGCPSCSRGAQGQVVASVPPRTWSFHWGWHPRSRPAVTTICAHRGSLHTLQSVRCQLCWQKFSSGDSFPERSWASAGVWGGWWWGEQSDRLCPLPCLQHPRPSGVLVFSPRGGGVQKQKGFPRMSEGGPHISGVSPPAGGHRADLG